MIHASILFGVAVGLWGGTWLSFIGPMVPFCLAYPFGFWAVFELATHRRRY